MDNKAILQHAIKKSIDGGYKHGVQWMHHVVNDHIEDYDYSGLIFDHDFAKALWGEPQPSIIKRLSDEDGEYDAAVDSNIGWQRHLQQMVIADDPIAYLGANL